MLESLATKRTKKGHAYSKIDAFRELPCRIQAALVLVALVLFVVLISFMKTHDLEDSLAGDKLSSEHGDEVSMKDAIGDVKRQLASLQEENENLRSQIRSQRSELVRSEEPRDDQPVLSHLGSFRWENFQVEENSIARRFWVKTATNEEGHHFYRRILIQNGWVETSNPNHEHCYFLFYGRFVPNLDQEFEVFQEGKHMINHIPGEFAVLNKEPFLHFVRDWSRKKDCDYTAMHPESYLIHTQKDCEDMFRLGDPSNELITSGETQQDRDLTYWFWKPPFNSFGRGIKVSTLRAIRYSFVG